jgi:hypothetical protein
MHTIIKRTRRRCKLKWNYPKFLLAEAMKTTNLDQTQPLERIDPKPLKPWRQPVVDQIGIETSLISLSLDCKYPSNVSNGPRS